MQTETSLLENQSFDASSQVDPVAYELVERLHDEIADESVVIFIGAGSTTERNPRLYSFYQRIRTKCSYPEDRPDPSFPELMEYFCTKLDGGQHNRLIREAIEYLEVFFLPGDERRLAISAIQLLAQIPYFSQIVTTNWDPLIERTLDILVPIIEDRDIAFWNDRKRQVLKIHGCITRPYSLIATTTDYEHCLTTSPLIFNKLKDLMATKTFLFIGYSLRDPDFQQLWESITGSLGKFAKLAYRVDPHASLDSVEQWSKRGVQIFKTDDVSFLEVLRARLVKEDLIPHQELLEIFQVEREEIIAVHLRNNQDSTGGLASAMYQDGLIHTLTDLLSATVLATKRKQDFESDLTYSRKIVRESLVQNDILEVAYWSGRTEVLRRFCERDNSRIPKYFHPDKLVPTVRYIQGTRWSEMEADHQANDQPLPSS